MLALIVMAKAPLSGLSKTRLMNVRGFSRERVARLADAFLRDTVRACGRVRDARLIVSFAPSESEPYFRELAPHAHLIVQVDGDLGARMDATCEAVFALGATRIVLIGMDTPHIDPRLLERAFRELEACDCVLGPAEDGGYYLIGLRQQQPEMFRDIEWSTSRVLAQSLARARATGVETVLLDELYDIDDAATLERLALTLGPDGEPCPHTARALAEHRASDTGERSI